LVLGLAVVGAACGDDDSAGAGPGDGGSESSSDTIRIGFFPNVTHAPALVGLEEGFFEDALGPDVDIETRTFNAGGEAVEAIFGGSIDITYVGPNPAIQSWQESDGEAVRLVAGSTSGGAALVVDPEITDAADLEGRTIASPALGNTQDVALRYWLAQQGFETDPEGGGDVSVLPQDNAITFDAFQQGQIDGAWVPEPWSSRLVEDAGATVLVDEAELWPQGRFVTTHVLVSSEFLEEHPDLVRAFLEAHVQAVSFANESPEQAQADVAKQISEITGSEVSSEVVAASWDNLEFTVDPIASSLRTSADHAIEVGLLDPVELDGIYALDMLNEILAEEGSDPVEGF
jgi:NitT/TauT family transport system substrate-binding protein